MLAIGSNDREVVIDKVITVNKVDVIGRNMQRNGGRKVEACWRQNVLTMSKMSKESAIENEAHRACSWEVAMPS